LPPDSTSTSSLITTASGSCWRNRSISLRWAAMPRPSAPCFWVETRRSKTNFLPVTDTECSLRVFQKHRSTFGPAGHQAVDHSGTGPALPMDGWGCTPLPNESHLPQTMPIQVLIRIDGFHGRWFCLPPKRNRTFHEHHLYKH